MHLILAIFIFTSISGKIQGIVKDEDTGYPIPYADVIIKNTQIGTTTDEDGYFYIFNIPPSIYTVEISCIGFQTKIINNVIVEIDQTARLNVTLKQTPIEIAPIIVTDERPAVTKDMVGTTYIIRKTEIDYLPIDYATHLISLQPSVATLDTALHVRGGRATEVLYLIDNVSIIDPQTGDPAITLSKGIIDEIIFLPGVFDAEYGRAMSGVINIITAHPEDNFKCEVYGKTERIMPYYYDFGYENFQSSVHVPISNRFKGIFSIDVMHTDDWNPKLFIQPHKQRDDYTLYGKWLFAPSGKMRLTFSGAKSRTQFDRYSNPSTFYKFHLDHYRSDMRKGNLQALNINYLPDSRKLLTVTLSRLYTKREYGVRESGPYGIFEDFVFRDYNTLEWPRAGINNPFGASYTSVICDGDYPEYQDKSSLIIKANIKANLQIHKYHEIKTGAEYSYLDLENFTYFLSDSIHQITDEYQYKPKEYFVYLQDNIDYKGLYAKIGCRYDYFSSGIEGIKPKAVISPRIGFSFMVTEKFLFRANIGRYAQPPLYDYMYGYHNLLPLPSYLYKYIPLIGNPELSPEKTTSYEIGLQGELRKNLIVTINTFYKDVSDLIGTRFNPATPLSYVSYFNVEYANVKGIESILEFANPLFRGKISYTLSYARGSSSYAEEIYYRYYYEDPDTSITPQVMEYYLDFDQRHRIFIQGVISLPLQTNLHLFGYFGEGFPYTPPGPEGKYEERNILQHPFQKQIDCVISKSLRIGKVFLNFDLEIINLLNARYQIAWHGPHIPLENIKVEDFDHPSPYIDINSEYYSPAADLNHDGLITPFEEYNAFRELMKATDDWPNAYTAPRRARIGITINFK